MGLGDMMDKAKDLASENADTVKEGIDKAADFVDEKTGGSYTDQIDEGADKAKELVDGLDD
ncbi:MAG: antitoxin [Acidimicrobiia bacterium]|nr:antitoxin [Acidimicrobiia bacterium]